MRKYKIGAIEREKSSLVDVQWRHPSIAGHGVTIVGTSLRLCCFHYSEVLIVLVYLGWHRSFQNLSVLQLAAENLCRRENMFTME